MAFARRGTSDLKAVQAVLVTRKDVAVQLEKHVCSGEACPLVAVEEGLALSEMKGIRGRHLEEIGVQDLPAERCPGIATAASIRPRSRMPGSPPYRSI